MIKAITFDLDNTLIDFIKMKKGASNAAATAMVKAGLKLDINYVKKTLFTEYMLDIEGNHVFQDFLKKHSIKSERILAAAMNAHMKNKFRYTKPFPKVKKVLKKLRKRGYKLGIVTDAPRIKAYQRLEAMDLTEYLDVVVGREDTGRAKPSTLPFKKALKLLKVEAKNALHVGDWPDKDILGAKKVGMKTCFARYGYLGKGKVVYADFKIKKFSDILDHL